ncbi:Papain-like cysteine protease AvrRpt2 [Evansella caseinilytica]|uniref:Papain-like cysteine protease AvrRpt2 n=1 Tax=Evansella caseinilytica TaxID=1503961 RepID=A0A1H3IE71_9BACI|nr:papain-like cysteine protease family protein [Evansella caseinilytica]SDY25842.1 Papain-like cysteine protease AvrRpt2 [Evansella caseinilytica]
MEKLIRSKVVIKVLVFSLIFLLTFTAQIFAGSISGYPAVKQEKSQWCWNASGVSILKYKDRSVSQCNFFKRTKGTSTCYNTTASTSEVRKSLLTYLVNSSYYSGHLTWAALKAQIDKNYPVYVSWKWNSNSNNTGHAVVAYGYYTALSTNYVYYMDPADGVKTSMAYSKFVGGSTSDRIWRWGLRDVH